MPRVCSYWKDVCAFCHFYSIPMEISGAAGAFPTLALPTAGCGVLKPNLI